VPAVAVYSIDEAFPDVQGLITWFGILNARARPLRRDVLAPTSISICVGMASTKSLIKIANRLVKQYPELHGITFGRVNHNETQCTILSQIISKLESVTVFCSHIQRRK